MTLWKLPIPGVGCLCGFLLLRLSLFGVLTGHIAINKSIIQLPYGDDAAKKAYDCLLLENRDV